MRTFKLKKELKDKWKASFKKENTKFAENSKENNQSMKANILLKKTRFLRISTTVRFE